MDRIKDDEMERSSLRSRILARNCHRKAEAESLLGGDLVEEGAILEDSFADLENYAVR